MRHIEVLKQADAVAIDWIALVEQKYFGQTVEIERQPIIDAIENPQHDILCIYDGRLVVGYLWYQVAADYCEILTIFSDPERRKQGLASELLQQLIAKMRANEVVTISLEVRASNSAGQKTYEKNGFQQIGNRKKYYKNPVEDGLIFNFSIV